MDIKYKMFPYPVLGELYNDYKNSKLAEGKHYFVALSHTSKKLIRVIYYLLKTNKSYQLQK